MDVLFAAMLSPTAPSQTERARWLRVKEFSDQISLLSSVAIASDRPLSTWEEGRIKDLAAKLLQELKGIESTSTASLPEKSTQNTRPVTQVPAAPANDAAFPQLDHNLQFLRQNLFPKPPTAPINTAGQNQPDPSLPKCLQERLSTVPPKRKRGRKAMDKTGFACIECGTTDTPEWRKGPNGKNSLCNACGLRWSKQFKPEKTDGVSSSSESVLSPAPAAAHSANPLSPRAGSPPPSTPTSSVPSSSSVSSLAAVASALSIPVALSVSSSAAPPPTPTSSISSILN